MQTLTAEENLIVQVARATCFAYRFASGETPEADVRLYVAELISLFRQKPHALLLQATDDGPDTVAKTVAFCAEQLETVAPAYASQLRDALRSDG